MQGCNMIRRRRKNSANLLFSLPCFHPFVYFIFASKLTFFFNVVNIEGIRQQAAYFDVFIIRHISFMLNSNPDKTPVGSANESFSYRTSRSVLSIQDKWRFSILSVSSYQYLLYLFLPNTNAPGMDWGYGIIQRWKQGISIDCSSMEGTEW